MSKDPRGIIGGGDISGNFILANSALVPASGMLLFESLKWQTQKYWQSMPNIFMARIGKYHALPKLIFDLSMYVK